MPKEQASRKFQKELNSGAVSLVLLSIIAKHKEPMYGYEIGKHLEELADDALPMNQAAIYPVLRSLERQSLLKSRSVPSKSGPPRKYYQLTTGGKKTLRNWTSVWMETTSFVNSILEMNDASTAKTNRQLSRKTRNRTKAEGRR